MFYGEIKEGDVLEWQTFGGQSTTILIVKAGEIVTYGSGKGKDKKIRPAFYIRSLHAFDDEPELVDAAHLKQNCKPAATTQQVRTEAAALGDDASEGDDSASSSQVEWTDENASAGFNEEQTTHYYSQDDSSLDYDKLKTQKKPLLPEQALYKNESK